MPKKEDSAFYFKYLNESSNRLDYVFHHPRYDKIKSLTKSEKFKDLDSIIIPNSIHQGYVASGKETGKIPFINIENLDERGTIDLTEVRYLDDAPRNRLLQLDDMLFSRSREIGICCVITPECVNAVCGSYIFFFKIKKDEMLPLYLAKYINSELGQMQIEYIQTGSSGNNINIDETKTIRIICPSTDEQQNILDPVLKLERGAMKIETEIETVKENINMMILDELAISTSGIEKQYFFKTGKDEKSPYFVIPFEKISDRLNYLFYNPKLKLIDEVRKLYSTTTLGQIATIRRGEQPKYDEDGEIFVIKTVDLKDSYIDFENCLHTTKEFFEQFPESHIKKNDVLVSSTGYVSMGKIDVFDEEKEAMADGHVSIMSLYEDYDPYFITFFLRSHLGKMQIEKWYTGSSGQIELQPEDLKKVIIPDNTEKGIPKTKQEEIAKKLMGELDSLFDLEQRKKTLFEDAKTKFNKLVSPYT